LQSGVFKTIVSTIFALIAFAANSVFCRLALGEQTIDAASFTIIRLLSGSLILFVLIVLSQRLTPRQVEIRGQSKENSNGSWLSGVMLFVYALSFSFAYITLDTATGALILFGSVQITMILLSVVAGNRLHKIEWFGMVVAFGGFVYLILPGVSAPSFSGFILMTVSGIAWGVYTLRGRGSRKPMRDTAYNFIRTIPLLFVVFLLVLTQINYTLEGVVLAILSGAVASGLGYTIWYMALGGLSATQAAVLQLLVPVIAAAGGVIFVSEALTWRLVFSAFLILSGILFVIIGRYYAMQSVTRLN